jgi:hypothetical protein
MALNPDFSDLFAAFNAAGVEYLVVGGYAVAFHAQPRFTKDLDVWINRLGANPERVMSALQAFGAPLFEITATDLAQAEVVLQIGIEPNRIDILTSIDGVQFLDAWDARVVTRYGDIDITVIGREHLIQNKRSVGRAQDLLDAAALEAPTS